MNTTLQTYAASETHRAGNAMALALRLVHAENALDALTAGQIDAVVNPNGQTYLLRPAQEQLRQNEAQMRALIASVADVLTVVDLDGSILFQSHSGSQVFGYEPDALVGNDFFAFVHQDDVERLQAAFDSVIQGLQAERPLSFRYRAHNGAYRLVEATLGALQDSGGEKVVFSLRPQTSAHVA